ncbi:ABC transporter ATP-binding protein [Dendrosporobacter sp. 1207_IL3150]|uniref:ABC transporter ATP-binding protein n=1 Tax=Dendrosporobacter sp. 1207_IL3150 TaxID=3084054 RepID=UPI002FDB72CD
MSSMPMVEMVSITKRFPGVIANDSVSIKVNTGEIHALLGENGAGKSTLMSILTGLYRPDEGEIYLRGLKTELSSPKDAANKGIGMVHQHFKLVKSFTVAENIMLGLKGEGMIIDRTSIEKRIREFCQQYGMAVDPAAKIWQLTVGEQQRVEIIKALFRGAEILILDEPTAVLTPQEAKDLYKTLRIMTRQGKAVIVISHKLSEVLEGTDTVTVLRGGKSVGTVKTELADEQELSRMMVGRHIAVSRDKCLIEKGKQILKLQGISCLNNRGQLAVQGISLDIHAGEILGIAGVAGNGQSELAEVIAGLRSVEEGTKYIDGVNHTQSTIRALVDAGVSYIPEDRMGTGLVPSLNAVDNYVLKSYKKHGWLMDWSRVKTQTQEVVERFSIKLASIASPVKMMSGGNLQKLLLAREIMADPRLIVAVYPMRGLDVGAMEAVRKLLLAQRDAGKAVLLISEELEELFALSDRIAVLHRGEIMGIVDSCTATAEEVGMMMAGKRMLEKDAM